MKLSISFLASKVLANSYNDCFENGVFLKQGFEDIPIGQAGISSYSIPNGSIECVGIKCTASCDDGYHFYGGSNISNCLYWGKKWRWNTNIAECKTCDEFNADNTDVIVLEKTANWERAPKKAVRITCPNGELIKPMNVKKVFAVCRCVRWPKDKMDNQDKCHWRVNPGDQIIDDNSLDSYYGNYWCNTPPSEEETTTVVTTTTTGTSTTTEEPPSPFRIPPGLVCKKHQEETSRIVGGLTAIPNSWPWIVDMNFYGSYCAGTIIDNKTILTAAHCCKSQRNYPERISMTIGEHDVWNNDAGQRTITAERVIMHPSYTSVGILNDICIIKFNSNGDINLRSHNSDAACLPSAGDEPAHGTRCWSAGWGLMQEGRNPAEELQEVDLQIYSHEECEKTNNSGYLVESAHLCAGWPQGGKDACNGDSGGPLICADDENQPVLVGVTSWGFGCARPDTPGIWTRVSSYIDWIEQHMN